MFFRRAVVVEDHHHVAPPPPNDLTVMPLSSMADAFEELEKKIIDGEETLRLDNFCQASLLLSSLFNCLGLAFKFAEMEYVAKLHVLMEASKRFDTLSDILDHDIAQHTVKISGSFSRNLRRVRQGLDLMRALFENFLSTDFNSLKEVASTAYTQVCAPYHTWAVRTAVAAGCMHFLRGSNYWKGSMKPMNQLKRK